MDRLCVSTCEAFLLDAMQSTKVITFGAGNTGGFLDYGNAVRVLLPSATRRFQMPRTRSRRLPERALDMTGLAPEVMIPNGGVDPVAFTVQWITRENPPRR
jgi:hypothetical protein